MNTTPNDQRKAINRAIADLERDINKLDRKRAELRNTARQSAKKRKSATEQADTFGGYVDDMNQQREALIDARNTIGETAAFREQLKRFIAKAA